MTRLNKALGGGLAAAALLVSGLALAAPASASSCSIYASTPTGNTENLSGTGGRQGCTNSVTLTVRLKKDRNNLPDGVLSTVSKSGTNFSLTASAGSPGSGKFYTETQSSTGSIQQSARKTQ